MTSAPTDEAARRRAARRRHLQQRQTVIFGGLLAVLGVVALAAAGVFTGILPSPIDPPFSTPEPTDTALPPPCPAADALPVAFSEVTVNVYNGTTRAGLAGSTAEQLAALGVLINSELNNPGGHYEGVTDIQVGAAGVTAGYTIAALFPEATITLETNRTDAAVNVVLGDGFEAMSDPAEAALDPETPIAAPAGCEPVPTPEPSS
ncbi:LytR C-terminal domain-containing protein [Beutenbergia cavernae]|uniref:LytR C-terminal domain-containing protein n=1 Tax=Beutenbergia cavernae TaxID=84757 RepID=UPI00019AD4D8|nr:LytR C-terminal domain-containing protein [Beutenbergia cavernae]